MLDNGFLVLSKIGRIALRWSRPIEGTPKTVTISREADGWYACFSCADVPVHILPPSGHETGIDLGLESFATLADGTPIFNPRCYRKAEAYLRRCAATGGAPQEGQSSAHEGGHAAGESASARRAAAAGLPPQRSPQAGAERTM